MIQKFCSSGLFQHPRLCVDGPGLARVDLRLVARWSGAALCSACLRDTMIAGPNAIRGSGPNYKRELGGPLAKTGFPNPRWSTGLALPRIHPATMVAFPAFSFDRRRLAIGFTSGQHRPGCPRNFVGQSRGDDLGRLSLHEIGQPRVLLEVRLSSVSDSGSGPASKATARAPKAPEAR